MDINEYASSIFQDSSYSSVDSLLRIRSVLLIRYAGRISKSRLPSLGCLECWHNAKGRSVTQQCRCGPFPWRSGSLTDHLTSIGPNSEPSTNHAASNLFEPVLSAFLDENERREDHLDTFHRRLPGPQLKRSPHLLFHPKRFVRQTSDRQA
jgi:hypothetical protein